MHDSVLLSSSVLSMQNWDRLETQNDMERLMFVLHVGLKGPEITMKTEQISCPVILKDKLQNVASI